MRVCVCLPRCQTCKAGPEQKPWTCLASAQEASAPAAGTQDGSTLSCLTPKPDSRKSAFNKTRRCVKTRHGTLGQEHALGLMACFKSCSAPLLQTLLRVASGLRHALPRVGRVKEGRTCKLLLLCSAHCRRTPVPEATALL